MKRRNIFLVPLPQCPFHRLYQFTDAERLGDVAIHLGHMQSKRQIHPLRFGRDHYDRDLLQARIGLHAPMHLPSINAGQHQVQQNQIGRIPSHGLQSFQAGSRSKHFEVPLAEDVPDQCYHFPIVFYEKDSKAFVRRHIPSWLDTVRFELFVFFTGVRGTPSALPSAVVRKFAADLTMPG